MDKYTKIVIHNLFSQMISLYFIIKILLQNHETFHNFDKRGEKNQLRFLATVINSFFIVKYNYKGWSDFLITLHRPRSNAVHKLPPKSTSKDFVQIYFFIKNYSYKIMNLFHNLD